MNAVDTELSATVGSKCVRLSAPHNTRLWSGVRDTDRNSRLRAQRRR